MLFYSLTLFAAAILLIVLGILIYRGHTNLIHDYHRTNVKDLKGYGKAMGKVMMGFSMPLIASGILAFFDESWLLTAILLGGMVIAFIPFIIVQKKYNASVF